MAMPELKKNQYQLMCGLAIVCLFCWVEYDSRLRVQLELDKRIEYLESQTSNIYKIEHLNKLRFQAHEDMLWSMALKKK